MGVLFVLHSLCDICQNSNSGVFVGKLQMGTQLCNDELGPFVQTLAWSKVTITATQRRKQHKLLDG